MKSTLLLNGLLLLSLSLTLLPARPLNAQVQQDPSEEQKQEQKQEQGGGLFDSIVKAVGDAAEDSLEQGIEELSGTYEGRIGEVELVERRGNSIVLKVKYEDVKRPAGAYVKGEVLRWGEVLDGFTNTQSSVHNKKGTVNLKISRTTEESESEWDVTTETLASDQIRLYLVRDTHPDRPFGSLVYDFQKTWTDSSEKEVIEETPEQTEQADDEESVAAIELADDETREQAGDEPDTQSTADPAAQTSATGLIRPGTSLTPVKTNSTDTSALKKTSGGVSDSDSKISAVQTARKIYTVSEYNFYENADKALWKSGAGKLPFPGRANDSRGFARTLEKGVIYPDNNAVNLLQTHPQWINEGWIQGRFPKMRLGRNIHFKATGALLKGAGNSDGVIMTVHVINDEGKVRRIMRKRITRRRYTPIEADLSAWAGKKVNLVLRVHTGRTSSQDWAVWVNPRLASE